MPNAPEPPDDGFDWEALRAEAVAAMGHAYAPYSGYSVGVAGLVDDGRVVSGCNVENAAYGVALCAECGMVSQLHLTGGGKLTHVVCVDGEGAVIMPCGRCRQLLSENSGPRHAHVDRLGREADGRGAAGCLRPRRPRLT